MNFGMKKNQLTTMNRFVLHTSHRKVTHLAVIARKTNIEINFFKGGGSKKRAKKPFQLGHLYQSAIMNYPTAL